MVDDKACLFVQQEAKCCFDWHFELHKSWVERVVRSPAAADKHRHLERLSISNFWLEIKIF